MALKATSPTSPEPASANASPMFAAQPTSPTISSPRPSISSAPAAKSPSSSRAPSSIPPPPRISAPISRPPSRYLKKDYQSPRLHLSNPFTRSLGKRIATARRPKILVAGLAKKIEAFLDPAGEYIGAVSTFSIYHPTDDIAALSTLLEKLLSPATTTHFVNHLGANALRGRHVTLKKSFLRNLPIDQPACSLQ